MIIATKTQGAHAEVLWFRTKGVTFECFRSEAEAYSYTGNECEGYILVASVDLMLKMYKIAGVEPHFNLAGALTIAAKELATCKLTPLWVSAL